MNNPNSINSSDINANDSRTGWEVVEAEAGKMDTVGEIKEIDHEVISKIDEYMMSDAEEPSVMARCVADLAGVAADIKPTALTSILPTDLNIDNGKLADMIRSSGLYITDDWKEGRFFVSKSPELSEKVRGMFKKLWAKEITNAEELDLGRLLGYPETAVAPVISEQKNVVDKFLTFFRKKKNPQLDRYYAHSLEHQEEEFEAYERPLHEYMEKHCPQATAASKEERAPNGKPYRW